MSAYHCGKIKMRGADFFRIGLRVDLAKVGATEEEVRELALQYRRENLTWAEISDRLYPGAADGASKIRALCRAEELPRRWQGFAGGMDRVTEPNYRVTR